MITDLTREFRKEFGDTINNIIWQNESGDYEVFGRYLIQRKKGGFDVWSGASNVGTFGSTRTALSWCIADKYNLFKLSRSIQSLDNKLLNLTNDINARAAIADRSKNPNFREYIATKLETKIIKKKLTEYELSKCVNSAKYFQQKGFQNETQRIGRGTATKTNR